MERPIMNPVSVIESPVTTPRSRRRRLAWRSFKLLFRLAWATLMLDVLHPLGRAVRDEGFSLHRAWRAILYRLLFAPVVLVLICAVLVYTGTHPPTTAIALVDPIGQGVYYDPITFLADDRCRLEAWLVPVLDAKRILDRKEKALGERHPAVILVHDFGATRKQMLPLVGPLHEAGFIVLAITLRGGESGDRGASTFGLTEAMDVKAAVDLLRHTPFVESTKIAVIGVGTGATAALLAGERDMNIAAIVADQPAHSGNEVIARFIAPQEPGMRWLSPFCKWSFDIAYGVDSSEIDLDRCTHALRSRPVLIFDEGRPVILQAARCKPVIDFLKKTLVTPARPLAA